MRLHLQRYLNARDPVPQSTRNSDVTFPTPDACMRRSLAAQQLHNFTYRLAGNDICCTTAALNEPIIFPSMGMFINSLRFRRAMGRTGSQPVVFYYSYTDLHRPMVTVIKLMFL